MKINLKDLYSKLEVEHYQDINILSDSDSRINHNNIKNGVLKNIDKKGFKFNNPFKKMWIAATIALGLMITTVFAFQNIEYFKTIFGNKAETIEKNIQSIMARTENEDYIFSLESLLSDGNQNYFIVSLERKDQGNTGDMFPFIVVKNISEKDVEGPNLSVISTEKIETQDKSLNKDYYVVKMSTSNNLIGENVKLTLKSIDGKTIDGRKTLEEEMSISFEIGENSNLKVVDIKDPQEINNNNFITEIKYSNLGIFITGENIEDIATVPVLRVQLKNKDGSIIEISNKLEDSDKYGFIYQKHGREFTNIITFKQLIDMDTIESIIINEVYFKLK